MHELIKMFDIIFFVFIYYIYTCTYYVVEQRKQAKLKFLQDPTQPNRDNYHTERRETSRTLRNKKRDYLTGKLSEIDTNSTNKNIRDLYKGIKDFKKG